MNAPSTDIEKILVAASERGRQSQLSYAGAVTPLEAYQLLAEHRAKIVDVRSRFEYDYIGRIDPSTLISWKFWPGAKPNSNFLAKLQAQILPSDIVLFLCRSGVRSHAAAAVAASVGFTRAFNILEGFEGDLDAHSQRGNIGGWRKAGLPWVQD